MTEEQEQIVEANVEEKAEETVEVKAEEKTEKPKKQEAKAEEMVEVKAEEKTEKPKKQEAKAEEKPEEPKKQKETGKAAPKPAAAKEGRMMTKDELIAAIKNMTVLDLSELVKALEAEFGVSAAAPVSVAATAATTQEAAPAEEEEKTEFTVMLKDVGPNKISVIKTVREVTGLGLKECKDLVEAAPTTVKESVGKEESATVKGKLEAAGATVEVK